MADISILPPDKAPALIPLLRVVHDLHSTARPDLYPADPSDDDLTALLMDWLAQPGVTAFVAGRPDAPKGYAIIAEETLTPSALRCADRRIILHHISVEPAQQRQGIGRALIDAAKAHAAALGITRLVTTYSTFNAPSAALMAACGLAPEMVVASAEL